MVKTTSSKTLKTLADLEDHVDAQMAMFTKLVIIMTIVNPSHALVEFLECALSEKDHGHIDPSLAQLMVSI